MNNQLSSSSLLQSTIAMKHGSKLIEQVFEDLNSAGEILSLGEFNKIIARNQINKKGNKKEKEKEREKIKNETA